MAGTATNAPKISIRYVFCACDAQRLAPVPAHSLCLICVHNASAVQGSENSIVLFIDTVSAFHGRAKQ